MFLVTGASGFLGAVVARHLVAKGERVRILIRPTSTIAHLQDIQHRLEIVEGDILDVTSLENAFIGVKKIIHCAAVVSYDSTNYDIMYKTNIEGTANVVNIALASEIEKIVHVSSIAAIGGKPDELITEETKWEKNKWTTHYGITKMLAEREIFRGIAEGLNAVIVNPGIILGWGKDDKATLRIFKRIQHQKMPFYTNGTNGFVAVEDVAAICIQLAEMQITAERFILVAENTSFKNYFYKIAAQLQVPPPKRMLTSFLAAFFILLDWMVSFFTRRKRNITKENVKISLEKFEYSNAKIKQTLGYTFISLEETIEKIAMQLKQ
ncbi:MAG TPA: NAD-dependent epimerase/dehydratase family protein [Chitinophagales bacterium]|nr:NAD-dependent epimerase/dehydratase family protein [Chitinophagales bacterium]HNM31389.1 NAD-dependent epimerase/dehydratase family protein [Chitinophagales bacterium]